MRRSQQMTKGRSSLPPNLSIGSLNGSIYASTIFSMENESNEAEKTQLNDQQWVMQRKKIGLSRKTKQFMSQINDSRQQKQQLLQFIRKTFNRKECVQYVPDPQKKGYGRPKAASSGPQDSQSCYCGAPEDEHRTRAQHLRSNIVKSANARFETIEEEFEEDDLVDSDDFMEETNTSFPMFRRARENFSLGSAKLREFFHRNPKVHDERRHDIIDELDTSMESGIEDIMNSKIKSTDTDYSLKMDKERGRKHVTFSQKVKNSPAAREGSNKNTEVWVEEKAIQEFPTNSFGQIEFENVDGGNVKPSKYVRLSDSTPISAVKELLVDYWKILEPHRPNLALSLIGGAKNFQMEGRKKETFKKGLISAAKSTNALILTGGTNTGTMKLVGDAVRDGQYMVQLGDKMVRGLKLIGLCPFGYIKDKDLLINDSINFNYVNYNSNVEIVHGDNVPLNSDHTHFLLIDDGSRYRFFGGDTNFITKFETMIRDPEPDGLGIPIVTLLLEGGKDAIRIVKERLKEGISCVVIEGSGRAADIISYAYKNAIKNQSTSTYTLKEGHLAHLMKLIEENYCLKIPDKNSRNHEMQNIMNWLRECIRYSDIITIFDIRRETHLDKKILSALLKSGKMTLDHQLFLAMVWNRVDLVEEKILLDYSLNKTQNLSDIMMQALLRERVDFIELLLMNGFSMRSFLTVEKLRQLYNEGTKNFKDLGIQLKALIGYEGGYLYLRTIHKLLAAILKEHTHRLYMLDMPLKGEKRKKQVIEVGERYFEEPYVELFIWAILTNKPELIDFCWPKCGQPILMALIAAAIYSHLSKFYSQQGKNIKLLHTRKEGFQEKANKILEMAYEKDAAKALSLLDKQNNRWGFKNLMQIAYIGQLRTFVANPICQTVVHSSWKRGFSKLPWYACIVCTFIPFLVWTPMVKFQAGLGDDRGQLSWMQKLFVFYRSPIVKYTGAVFSFLMLIGLYSYVALFGFAFQYQRAELTLYAWMSILLLDGIREVLVAPSKSIKGKLADYTNSVWNKFDIIMYLTLIVIVVLKNFPETFMVARVLFAICSAFFYIRVFRIYHASRSLGPKLVIFHRMLPEIVTFMFLLLIFILAYGVASHALINPYRIFTWESAGPLIFDIIFLPYWQMYGELQLDSIKVKKLQDCPTALSEQCFHTEIENLEQYNYVIPILLAIYLLIGNVMLLNLLIAIFTSVFEEVHVNSNEVWKWEMYRLVEEYDKKPGLAPPFVIFEDIFKLMKAIWKKFCRSKRENLDLFMLDTLNTLKIFERDVMATFLGDEAKTEQESLNFRVKDLEQKMDQLLELFEEAPDEDFNWGETVDMDKKLFEPSDDFTTSDSEVEDVTKMRNNRKLRKLQNNQERNPKTARIQTARGSRRNINLQNEIGYVRSQLENIVEQRKQDIEKQEKMNKDMEKRLEKLITGALIKGK